MTRVAAATPARYGTTLAIYSAQDVLCILKPVDGEPQPPRELAMPVIRALVLHQLEWGYADGEIARGLRSLEEQLPGYPREFAEARNTHRSTRLRTAAPAAAAPPPPPMERPHSWWRRSHAAQALVSARPKLRGDESDATLSSSASSSTAPSSPPPVVVKLWGMTRCVIPRK